MLQSECDCEPAPCPGLHGGMLAFVFRTYIFIINKLYNTVTQSWLNLDFMLLKGNCNVFSTAGY